MIRALLTTSSLGAIMLAGQAFAQTPADKSDQDRKLENLKRDLIDTTPGFYVSPIVSLGYVAGEAEVAQANLEVDFDGPLYRAGIAAGYQVKFLRVELELGIGHADLELDQLNRDQEVSYFKYGANTFVDVPYDVFEKLPYDLPEALPYVGFGLGGISVDFKGGDRDDGLLAEWTAGLGIRLSPRWFLDAGTRLTYLPSIENQGADNEIFLYGGEAKLRYRF